MPLSEQEQLALADSLQAEIDELSKVQAGPQAPAATPRQKEDLAASAKSKLRQPSETPEVRKKRARVAGLRQRSRLDPYSQGSENQYDPSSFGEGMGQWGRAIGRDATAAINPLYRTVMAGGRALVGDTAGAGQEMSHFFGQLPGLDTPGAREYLDRDRAEFERSAGTAPEAGPEMGGWGGKVGPMAVRSLPWVGAGMAGGAMAPGATGAVAPTGFWPAVGGAASSGAGWGALYGGMSGESARERAGQAGVGSLIGGFGGGVLGALSRIPIRPITTAFGRAFNRFIGDTGAPPPPEPSWDPTGQGRFAGFPAPPRANPLNAEVGAPPPPPAGRAELEAAGQQAFNFNAPPPVPDEAFYGLQPGEFGAPPPAGEPDTRWLQLSQGGFPGAPPQQPGMGYPQPPPNPQASMYAMVRARVEEELSRNAQVIDRNSFDALVDYHTHRQMAGLGLEGTGVETTAFPGLAGDTPLPPRRPPMPPMEGTTQPIAPAKAPRVRPRKKGAPPGGTGSARTPKLYETGREPGARQGSMVDPNREMDWANYPQQFLPGMGQQARLARYRPPPPPEAAPEGGYLDPNVWNPTEVQMSLPFEPTGRGSNANIYDTLFPPPTRASRSYDPRTIEQQVEGVARPEGALERRIRLMGDRRDAVRSAQDRRKPPRPNEPEGERIPSGKSAYTGTAGPGRGLKQPRINLQDMTPAQRAAYYHARRRGIAGKLVDPEERAQALENVAEEEARIARTRPTEARELPVKGTADTTLPPGKAGEEWSQTVAPNIEESLSKKFGSDVYSTMSKARMRVLRPREKDTFTPGTFSKKKGEWVPTKRVKEVEGTIGQPAQIVDIKAPGERVPRLEPGEVLTQAGTKGSWRKVKDPVTGKWSWARVPESPGEKLKEIDQVRAKLYGDPFPRRFGPEDRLRTKMGGERVVKQERVAGVEEDLPYMKRQTDVALRDRATKVLDAEYRSKGLDPDVESQSWDKLPFKDAQGQALLDNEGKPLTKRAYYDRRLKTIMRDMRGTPARDLEEMPSDIVTKARRQQEAPTREARSEEVSKYTEIRQRVRDDYAEELRKRGKGALEIHTKESQDTITKRVHSEFNKWKADNEAAQQARASVAASEKAEILKRPVVHRRAQHMQLTKSVEAKSPAEPLPTSEAPKNGILLKVPKEYEGHVFVAEGTRGKANQFYLKIGDKWTTIAPRPRLDGKVGVVVRSPKTGKSMFLDSGYLERNDGDLLKALKGAMLEQKGGRVSEVRPAAVEKSE